MGAIRDLCGEPRAWRPRQVLLLPHTGPGAVFVAAAELAVSGGGGHVLVAADRNPERDSRLGAGRALLGQRRKDVHLARLVSAILLRPSRPDPYLFGLSGLAAVIRRRHAAASDPAGLCARLVFRRYPYAIDPVLDARSIGRGICKARPAEGLAAVAGDRQARVQ